jgi:hypothetical protein
MYTRFFFTCCFYPVISWEHLLIGSEYLFWEDVDTAGNVKCLTGAVVGSIQRKRQKGWGQASNGDNTNLRYYHGKNNLERSPLFGLPNLFV